VREERKVAPRSHLVTKMKAKNGRKISGISIAGASRGILDFDKIIAGRPLVRDFPVVSQQSKILTSNIN